jgi:hypothetical protein
MIQVISISHLQAIYDMHSLGMIVERLDCRTQKVEKRVKIANTILDWCTGQAGCEKEHKLSMLVAPNELGVYAPPSIFCFDQKTTSSRCGGVILDGMSLPSEFSQIGHDVRRGVRTLTSSRMTR